MQNNNHPLNKIVNPETGRRVDVMGVRGRNVLSKYIRKMTGAGVLMSKDEVKKWHKKRKQQDKEDPEVNHREAT